MCTAKNVGQQAQALFTHAARAYETESDCSNLSTASLASSSTMGHLGLIYHLKWKTPSLLQNDLFQPFIFEFVTLFCDDYMSSILSVIGLP